jgi:hypothetical protein
MYHGITNINEKNLRFGEKNWTPPM